MSLSDHEALLATFLVESKSSPRGPNTAEVPFRFLILTLTIMMMDEDEDEDKDEDETRTMVMRMIAMKIILAKRG